jgi:hypothetical protein
MFSRLLVVLYQELAGFYQISLIFPIEMFVLIVQQIYDPKTSVLIIEVENMARV